MVSGHSLFKLKNQSCMQITIFKFQVFILVLCAAVLIRIVEMKESKGKMNNGHIRKSIRILPIIGDGSVVPRTK